MARSTSASTTSATPTETFSDLMSKFMTHSPSSDLTWKQKDTPAEYSLDATSYASQHIMLWSLYRAVFEISSSLFVWPQIHRVATGCKYKPRQSETYVELIKNHESFQGRGSK